MANLMLTVPNINCSAVQVHLHACTCPSLHIYIVSKFETHSQAWLKTNVRKNGAMVILHPRVSQRPSGATVKLVLLLDCLLSVSSRIPRACTNQWCSFTLFCSSVLLPFSPHFSFCISSGCLYVLTPIPSCPLSPTCSSRTLTLAHTLLVS